MKGDQGVVVNRSVAWASSGRLCNLPSYYEGSVFVVNEPPYSITSLEKKRVGIFGWSEVSLDLLGLVRTTRPPIEWFHAGARGH